MGNFLGAVLVSMEPKKFAVDVGFREIVLEGDNATVMKTKVIKLLIIYLILKIIKYINI